MTRPPNRATGAAHEAVLSAIGAITGQPQPVLVTAAAEEHTTHPSDTEASRRTRREAVNRLRTRLGLAPALTAADAAQHTEAITNTVLDPEAVITRADLRTWDALLRRYPERVPTIARNSVVIPPLSAGQTHLWRVLADFDAHHPDQPWVLVGGQMVILHCLENNVTPRRATDDGDIVVGVWTRRDALTALTRALRARDFTEQPTHDGYGYRYTHTEDLAGTTIETSIDLMVPEGMDRQRTYPTTATGRRGLPAPGGNQALTRAERVPVLIDGSHGHIRRPSLLGALVAKAHALRVDGRNPQRHAEDLIALADIALRTPRTVLKDSTSSDSTAVRRALSRLDSDYPHLFTLASDPEGTRGLLARLARLP